MSLPEIKLFRLNYDAVINDLRNYAGRAVERGALAVILIGSLARGDYTAFSDADVIIIIGESDERPIDRIVKYMEPRASVIIEPRVYTLKELRSMINRGDKIVKEIVRYGMLLGGDEKIMEEIRRMVGPEH